MRDGCQKTSFCSLKQKMIVTQRSPHVGICPDSNASCGEKTAKDCLRAPAFWYPGPIQEKQNKFNSSNTIAVEHHGMLKVVLVCSYS